MTERLKGYLRGLHDAFNETVKLLELAIEQEEDQK